MALPTYLNTVRAQLYGTDPDRYLLNFRTWQYLSLLHASSLEPFVYALDPRVSYTLNDPVLINLGGIIAQKVAGGINADFFPIGSGTSPDTTGRMHHLFSVTIPDPSTVTVERLTRPLQKVDFALDLPVIPLAFTDYGFRLATADTSQEWLVDVVNRPVRDVSAILHGLETVGEPILDQLFGIGNQEPFKTFRNLWREKREVPLKFGALLIAVVYRSEQVRQGGGA